MSEIVTTEIAKDVDLKISFAGGKATIAIQQTDKMGETQITRTLDAGYLLDKIEEAIPGDWDKAPFMALKALIATI